ncbi:hypothetical protein DPSP01_011950 [Paraphaeosphaeria sporulosa]|uniref:Uncharacterized protein n=1 Tax=Paraphaeosphaeria sporulosa TaxID=1460663 RepID=A0A177CXC1_9PLEO|nr:uncharacterized protein CC84DRAFT_1200772 [Paraphaeosphaeria sporulosa]OAG11510.1 hypothetical protein CC84DRAFT_1200772 [Paraphaeosphaeria sporulosa]
MAPRRGGGSGSSFGGGSSDPVCPGFLNDSYATYFSTTIVYFVSYCLFFVLTFAVLIFACCVRKRSASLIGLLLAVLGFMSVAWALVILGTVLRECWVLPNILDYYNFAITFNILFNIGQWLLLFIQVWGVNRLLSKRLGSGQAVVKIATLAVTGVMAALTAGYIGLYSYNRWTVVNSWRYDEPSEHIDRTKLDDERKLAAAYWILYLLSVVAGGAISAALLMQLRSKSIPVNDVMKRTIALILCMLLWVIFQLVTIVEDLQDRYLDVDTNTAMYYLDGFFQIFSYVAIVSLCKLNFWKDGAAQTAYNTTGYGQPAFAPMQPPQQQYAYNGQPNQPYQYQQQSVHHNVSGFANGNGHMVSVK